MFSRKGQCFENAGHPTEESLSKKKRFEPKEKEVSAVTQPQPRFQSRTLRSLYWRFTGRSSILVGEEHSCVVAGPSCRWSAGCSYLFCLIFCLFFFLLSLLLLLVPRFTVRAVLLDTFCR